MTSYIRKLLSLSLISLHPFPTSSFSQYFSTFSHTFSHLHVFLLPYFIFTYPHSTSMYAQHPHYIHSHVPYLLLLCVWHVYTHCQFNQNRVTFSQCCANWHMEMSRLAVNDVFMPSCAASNTFCGMCEIKRKKKCENYRDMYVMHGVMRNVLGVL